MSFAQARDPSIDRRYRPRPQRRVNLVNLIAEDDEGSDSWGDDQSDCEIESTGSSSCTTQSEGALVYLRLRPVQGNQVASRYERQGNVWITKNCTDNNGRNIMEKHFTFTDIIDATVPQASVYDSCIRHSIETEENLTILTYGTSGSGKTHTQIGDAENPGMIPRAIEHIFNHYGGSVRDYPCFNVLNSAINFLDNDEIEKHLRLRRKMLVANCNERYNHDRLKSVVLNEHNFECHELEDKSVFVWISFAEIYNERVYDLLNPAYEEQLSKKKGLTIVSNKGHVFIKNLTSIFVRNSFEAQLLLRTGTQRITFGSTAVNNHSSRSHFVFFIDVITSPQPDTVTFHSYKFCDLAGSERLHKTKNVGNRLKEAQRINTSLLVLGRCLDAVYHSQQKKNADVIPYRESKLTTLLQAALVGKEKMTMIVNINPSDDFFEENLHVLGFASIAKNIVFKPKPKKEVKQYRYSWLAVNGLTNTSLCSSENYEILKEENKILTEENESMANEIARLERALTTQEMDLKKMLINEYEERMRRQEENWKRRMELKTNYYEEKIRMLEERLRNKSISRLSPVNVSDSDSELDSDELL